MSVRADLNASNRNDFFELFGFDFLIDEDWRTWLIECNTNPYLGIPNQFIKDLMPQMVDDMLSIILDEKFPRSAPKTDPDRPNGFKLLYRKLQREEEDPCKCKNKDRCRCKKEWGMGERLKKLKAKKKAQKEKEREEGIEEKEVLPDVNLRRPFNTSLYPFPDKDPWIEQTGKPLTFKEIQLKSKVIQRGFGAGFTSPKASGTKSPKQR